ncbi:MAG: hypothetical protein V4613_00770 [Bacteroidota bacterium]
MKRISKLLILFSWFNWYSTTGVSQSKCMNFAIDSNNVSQLYDPDGKLIVEAKDMLIQNCYGDEYFVVRQANNYGIIDKTGKIVVPLIYLRIEECRYNKNNFIIHDVIPKVYLVDLNGGVTYRFKDEPFEMLNEIDTNYFICGIEKECFFIDLKRNRRIPLGALDYLARFELLHPNVERFKGLTFYFLRLHPIKNFILDSNGQFFHINGYRITNVNQSFTHFISTVGDTAYVLNKKGEIIKKINCIDAMFYSDTLIHCRTEKKEFLTSLNSQKKSKLYKDVSGFGGNNDSLYYCYNNYYKVGLMDNNYNLRYPLKYHSIEVIAYDSIYYVTCLKFKITIRTISGRITYTGEGSVDGYIENYIFVHTGELYQLVNICNGKVLLESYNDLELIDRCGKVRYKTKEGVRGVYDIKTKKFYPDIFTLDDY